MWSIKKKEGKIKINPDLYFKGVHHMSPKTNSHDNMETESNISTSIKLVHSLPVAAPGLWVFDS